MGAASRRSGGAEAKRKRTRRGARRTAVAADNDSSDSSSSSSSSSDSEEEAVPKEQSNELEKLNDAQRRRQQALAEIESDSDDSSSSSSSRGSSDDEGVRENGDGATAAADDTTARRRRNRKRARPAKAAATDNVSASEIKSNAEKPQPMPKQDAVEAAKNLEDPIAQDMRNEKLAAALAYVRQYLIDRPSWKFNKAKQEYLIRHMLQPDAAPSETGVAAVEPTKEAGDEQDEGAMQAAGWPERWNVCVAAYLNTIQGGAKTRFVGKLQGIAQQSEPVAPTPPLTASSAADAEATAVPSQSTAAQDKTVRFGDVAMSAEQDDNTRPSSLTSEEYEAAKAAYESAVFARQRARTLLELLGEPIWA